MDIVEERFYACVLRNSTILKLLKKVFEGK